MPDFDRTDAVLDAQGEQVVIWHVQTGLDDGMSRLTGAWVTGRDEPEKIAALLERRRCLITSAGEKALAELEITVERRIDPVATVAAIEAEREALQAVYDALPAPHTFVAPIWPPLPEPLDLTDPPASDAVPPTGTAHAVASWLAGVADTWEKVERERITRKYLHDTDSRDRRLTPFAVR
ncbi:hypothetical protein N8J89_11665 [Crossiella sp. CA-258035]|uniref:hypothetical protein n=1 Tax=Crossiella sp. CA-258035 TaxID=2981138 RepID=UPI0024BD1C73|nr:hypothetical protein [Crossiella sp. CA-258035]WHT21689.1 hypothetical protein N8J89_11665 [Crossiella sp. CA-258035]